MGGKDIGITMVSRLTPWTQNAGSQISFVCWLEFSWTETYESVCIGLTLVPGTILPCLGTSIVRAHGGIDLQGWLLYQRQSLSKE